MKLFLIGLMAACFALPSFAPEATICNPEKLRTYGELFGSANLVLIVEPLAIREATEQDEANPPKELRKYLDSFVVRLAVVHVIKGSYNEETLDLVHLRWKKDAPVFDESQMVVFKTQQEWPGKKIAKKMAGCYTGLLLFLSKTKDGRYEFLTGQETPSQSVRELSMPKE